MSLPPGVDHNWFISHKSRFSQFNLKVISQEICSDTRINCGTYLLNKNVKRDLLWLYS